MTRMLITAGRAIAPMIPASFNEVLHFSVKAAISDRDKPKFLVRSAHTGLDYARTTLLLPDEMDITEKPLYTYIQEAMEK